MNIARIKANPATALKPLFLFAPAITCAAIYLSLFRDALTDDAFITLQYARTLANSGTWGIAPGSVTNTATSPLNVILVGRYIPLPRRPDSLSVHPRSYLLRTALVAGWQPRLSSLLLKLYFAWRKWPTPLAPEYRLENFPAGASFSRPGTIKSWHAGTEWRPNTMWCFVPVTHASGGSHLPIARGGPVNWRLQPSQ